MSKIDTVTVDGKEYALAFPDTIEISAELAKQASGDRLRFAYANGNATYILGEGRLASRLYGTLDSPAPLVSPPTTAPVTPASAPQSVQSWVCDFCGNNGCYGCC